MDNENNQTTENKTDYKFSILILETFAVTVAVIAVVIIKTLFPAYFEEIKVWYDIHFSEEIHLEEVIGSFPDSSELSIGEYDVTIE